MPFKNYHAARQKDPKGFKSFANKLIAPGIQAVLGIIGSGKAAKSTIQSLHFDKTKYTAAKAKSWLKKHGFTSTVEPAMAEGASTGIIRAALLENQDVNENGSLFTEVADAEDWLEEAEEAFDTVYNAVYKAVREDHRDESGMCSYSIYKLWPEKVVLKKCYWSEDTTSPLFVFHQFTLSYLDENEQNLVAVLDEGQTVKLIFVPVDAAAKDELAAVKEHDKQDFGRFFSLQESAAVDIDIREDVQTAIEFVESFASSYTDAKLVEGPNGQLIIKNVSVISEHSLNGRTYDGPVQEAAIPLFEGAKAYIDHATEAEAGEPRRVRDVIGQHRNVRYDKAKKMTFSDLYLVPSKVVEEVVRPIAESNPSLIGNSIVARGVMDQSGRVKKITAVRSIDLVAEPATTHGLHEAARIIRENQGNQLPIKGSELTGGNVMTLEEMLKDKALVDAARSHFIKEIEESQKYVKMEQELVSLRKENLDMKTDSATKQLEVSITSMINEAKIPDTIKKDPALRTLLIEAKDDASRKAMIGHYEKIAAGQTGTSPLSLFSEQRPSGMQLLEGGRPRPEVVAGAAKIFSRRA